MFPPPFVSVWDSTRPVDRERPSRFVLISVWIQARRSNAAVPFFFLRHAAVQTSLNGLGLDRAEEETKMGPFRKYI